MAIYTTLNSFTDPGKSSICELIESNLTMFFDWGVLNAGSFFNVSVPTSGQYGGNKHQLRLVQDPNYSLGRVWEGYRSNWVWQSGLDTSVQPIQVSGVRVANTFYPLSTVGTYSHIVDYPNGRIIFNSPIPTGSVVTCQYTHKWINVVNIDKVPWFKELQYNSNRIDSSYISQVGSGDWFGLGQTRLQMPIIAVEMSNGGYSTPYALGGGKWVYRRGVFHVFSEDEQTSKRLADMIQAQADKTIFMVDLDAVGSSNRFPLNPAGSIASGALTYPQMIEAFKGNKVRMIDVEIEKMSRITPSLFHLPVSMTTEAILPQ